MTTIMVARNPDRGITEVHHQGRRYKSDRKGRFEVEDGHVEALRAHGLKLEGEPDDAKAAVKQAADLAAENAELKRQLAEAQAALAKK